MNAGEINYELKQLKKSWESFKDNHFQTWVRAIEEKSISEAERQAGMVTAYSQCLADIESLIRRIDGQ